MAKIAITLMPKWSKLLKFENTINAGIIAASIPQPAIAL